MTAYIGPCIVVSCPESTLYLSVNTARVYAPRRPNAFTYVCGPRRRYDPTSRVYDPKTQTELRPPALNEIERWTRIVG